MKNSSVDISELMDIVRRNSENIFWGAGFYGKAIYEYLRENYSDFDISCFAVSSMDNNPLSIGNAPVIEIKCLMHMVGTANFFITVDEEKTDIILGLLNELGASKVYRIKKEVYSEVTKTKRRESILDLDYLTRIENKIELQSEIQKVNGKAFEKYYNAFWGEKVVIVATGPSLKFYTPISNAIHIGVNNSWKKNEIKLDYFFIQDGSKRLINDGYDKWKDNVECPAFVGRYVDRKMGDSMEYPDYRIYKSCEIKRYFIDYSMSVHISKDISCHPVMNFGSVVFSALHFALYSGAETIYLVGCDTNSEGHFDNDRNISNYDIARNKIGFALVKQYKEYRYPDVNIVSVNPVGLKGLFDEKY